MIEGPTRPAPLKLTVPTRKAPYAYIRIVRPPSEREAWQFFSGRGVVAADLVLGMHRYRAMGYDVSEASPAKPGERDGTLLYV